MEDDMLHEESYKLIPLKDLEPHPDFLFRFEYDDIEGTADSIKRVGQLQPGWVVERHEGGYWVFIGIRRLMACKLLFARDGKPTTYKAFVVNNITLPEMFLKAREENATEKGERKNLSILEELRMFNRFREKIDDWGEIGLESTSIMKRVRLSEELSDDILRKLHMIEKKSGFEFKLGHLEGIIARSNDEKVILEAAAILAAGNLLPSKANLDFAYKKLDDAPAIEWFSELFPEYANKESASVKLTEEEKKYLQSVIDDAEESEESKANFDAKEKSVAELNKDEKKMIEQSKTRSLDIATMYELSQIIKIRCPHCMEKMPAKPKLKESEITFYRLGTTLEKRTNILQSLHNTEIECSNCGKEFFLNLAEKDGFIMIECTKDKQLREPREKAETGSVDFDQRQKLWVMDEQ